MLIASHQHLMSTVEELLGTIAAALAQTTQSLDKTYDTFFTDAEALIPPTIRQIIASSGAKPEGMSLLSLKSNSLLSYLHNLALVVLAHVERLDGLEDAEKLKAKAVEGTVRQRVTLEKGVKPLEKKLEYQLDKMVRSFHRMEEETAQAEKKAAEKAQLKEAAGSNSDSSSGSGSDSDSDDEQDALSYRPDASGLVAASGTKTKTSKTGDKTTKTYKPPKILAVAPPSAQFDDKAGPKKVNRKLQSMEEYLEEASDMPRAEASIGATIVGHGRGGVKTSRDRQKERDIQRYEEENFTRLPGTATKKTFKQKMAERANTFAGEDWSMFNNSRNLREGTSRKRKAGSAWDRAKRSRS